MVVLCCAPILAAAAGVACQSPKEDTASDRSSRPDLDTSRANTASTVRPDTGGVDPETDSDTSGEEESSDTETTRAADSFRVSLSVSPFTPYMIEDFGWTFSDGASEASTASELQALYVDHGATEVFVRVSTERHATTVNTSSSRHLGHAVEVAELALEAGLPLASEIILTPYCDVTCQVPPDFSEYPELAVPGEWMSLSIEEMEEVLEAYGRLVAGELVATGVEIPIWEIGNEVDFGTAGVTPEPAYDNALLTSCQEMGGGGQWYSPPDAINPAIGTIDISELEAMPTDDRIAWLEAELWPHEARLLAATAAGVHAVDPTARIATHIAHTDSPAFATAFLAAMEDGGFSPDVLGLSFYPSGPAGGTGSIADLVATAEAIRTEHDTEVFVAEFAHPSAESILALFGWNNEVDGYPFTEEGQADMMRDLFAWGHLGGLVGVRPWAPDYGVLWSSMALFDTTGGSSVPAPARPALEAIDEGMAQATDPWSDR